MALAKQIDQFRIVANSTNHDINMQNMEIDTVFEDYADAPQSVGGKLFKRMAGMRDRVRITYDESIQESEWRDLINDIVTDFVTNGVESIEFYPDSDNTTASDKIDVIPEDLSHLASYQDQMGRFQPTLDLVSVDRKTTITSNFQAP